MDLSSLTDLFKFQSDFSQGGLIRFIIVLLFSLFYGIALAYVYKIYYRSNEPLDISISRALPLMSPAVTTIFWLIQFSLPLSLGLLGALSFVRFRTPVKRAEDISFILILVSGALAAAVGHFLSALLLVLVVAGFGKYRNKFPMLAAEKANFAIVSIHSTKDISLGALSSSIKTIASSAVLVSSGKHDGLLVAVYNVANLAADNADALIKSLRAFDSSLKIDIYYPDNQLGTY